MSAQGGALPTQPLVERWGALQSRGLIGPGRVEALLAHSEGFREVVESVGGGPPRQAAADLGSGVGIPGLALALWWPESRWSLIEANHRRAGAAEAIGRELGLAARVEVRPERAEDVGRGPGRGTFALVVSRLFGPPAVVAECGAPLLGVGGRLVVSEPPEGAEDRWPADEVAPLGLALVGSERAAGARFAVLEQVEPSPDRYPRRPGIPTKRPLW